MEDRGSSRKKPLLGVAFIAALGLVAAGCSGLKSSSELSLVQGKILFIKNCGSCHALARADSTAEVGPNLDAAFAESLHAGFGRTIIGGIVQQQIQYPNSAGTMPKLPLSTRQAGDIAAYVQYAAARPGKDTGLLATAGGSNTGPSVATEKNGVLALEADPSGRLAYTATKATATAGTIKFTMTNTSGVPHNLAIQAGNSGATPSSSPVLGHTPITPKGTTSFTVSLKAGVYTYFCEVPGHREAGMWGTLTVK